MRQVVLIFPDTSRLTDYILDEHISHADVNSRAYSLDSILTEQQIATACTSYGAVQEKLPPKFYDEGDEDEEG